MQNGVNITIITVKFLVCVVPNLSVIYVSEGYTGRISDEDSSFSDEI